MNSKPTAGETKAPKPSTMDATQKTKTQKNNTPADPFETAAYRIRPIVGEDS